MENVRAEVRAERLPWSQAAVLSLCAPFPARGQLDVLKEGQEDEGDDEADAAFAALWDDRDDVSDEEEAGAPTRLAEAHEPALAGLGPEAADAVMDAHNQRAAFERLLADAAQCGNPRVCVTIKNALHSVERHLRSRMSEEGPVATALQEYEGARQRAVAQERAQAARADAEERKAKQMRATVAAAARRLTEQRAVFKARKLKQRLGDVKKKAPLKFDDADLGAGEPSGGRARHRENRRALFMRLVERGPPLRPELAANLDRIWRQADGAEAARYTWRWGHVFRVATQRVQSSLWAGDGAALDRFVSALARLGTAPAITLS